MEKPYLQRAELSGYKSIRDVQIDLHPGLNVIIGYNGVGKTNFMEFLDEFLSVNLTNEFLDRVEWYFEGHLFFTHKEFPSLEIRLLPTQSKRKEYTISPEYPREFFFDPLFIRHGVPNELEFFADDAQVYFQKHINQDQSYGGTFSASRLFYYYLSKYSYYPKEKDEPLPGKEDIYPLIHQFVADFLDFIKEFNLVDSIRFAEEQVLVEHKSDAWQTSVWFRPLKVLYKIDGNEYQFSELSDGAKRLIYVLSELYYFTRPDIEYPVQRPILLEEPELGVHPHLLFLLLQKLRNISYNHQIILTTHSPQVLDILEIEELDRIIIADYDKDKGTTLRHLTDEQIAEATEYMENTAFLSDYWQHTNHLQKRPEHKV